MAPHRLEVEPLSTAPRSMLHPPPPDTPTCLHTCPHGGRIPATLAFSLLSRGQAFRQAVPLPWAPPPPPVQLMSLTALIGCPWYSPRPCLPLYPHVPPSLRFHRGGISLCLMLNCFLPCWPVSSTWVPPRPGALHTAGF